MGTPATGELRPLASGGHEARIRIIGKVRRGFEITGVAGKDAARERCTAMAQIATRLRAAGHADKAEKILKAAAKAKPGAPWQAVVEGVDLICGGRATNAGPSPITMKELGEDWRSGKLHQRYPDHVGPKKPRSVTRDEGIARLYVDTKIGDHAVADVTLEDCEHVMAELPPHLSSSSRRSVAVYIRRVLQLAVYPLRLRAANPIPKGWLPRIRDGKALECLYPDEDRKLLACVDVPLVRRLLYGFDTREGMRTDELGRLTWDAIDLERGRLALDENKTDDPRDWDLDPSVWRALKAWKDRYYPDAGPKELVFRDCGVLLNINRLPYFLRRDLKKAGVTREKLFEKSAVRRPIRAHDLRATFVTVALATGKTETWVKDRTGHKSSGMVERYRRKARGWNMGPLDPLDEAIPELAADCRSEPSGGSGPQLRGDAPASSAPRVPHETHSEPVKQAVSSDSEMQYQQARSHEEPIFQGDRASEIDRDRVTLEAHGALMGHSNVDPLEAALLLAAQAGRFDVVSQLAKELEARRLAGSNVVPMVDAKRERR